MNSSLWYQNAVFYEVNVRAFRDSNGDGIGDLVGVIQKLDYLKELGVDCLWLLPIYPSPLLDDGYDIADYYNIHPDYGNLDDFKTLLVEAHARGLRVITDLVVNHTSDQHPWFQESRSDRSSPYRDYYVWSDDDNRYSETRIIFLDTEVSNWTWDEKAGQYFWHRFYSSQPDLNFDNPAVQQEIIAVMDFWLKMGVDGFRVDAVPYLFEREGTNCENLPETHVYLKKLRSFVEQHYPGRILLCEANQWPQDVRAYLGDGDEFHMAFHFPVMPRIYMALATADRTPVVEILAATPPIPENCQWCTFLRNHDELTLEMVTPEERQFMWNTYAPLPRMRLNLGIRRRLAPLLGGDRRKIELLDSILFTLPGSPIVYYGDEIGMGDSIWLEDRDGVRTPMQWNSGPNAGFSEAPAERLYSQPIRDDIFGYQAVNVETQRHDPDSLMNVVRGMIAARKAHPAFARPGCKFLDIKSPSVLATQCTLKDETLLAIHNFSEVSQKVELDLAGVRGSGLHEILSRRAFIESLEGPALLQLGPFGYLWLQSEQEV
ncbi:MAG: maltose alpha-D-glucosyltransferase [Chloroflexota bacterium]|nr:MAG: maltose alpha-D-glucosyltransferase [Chloroflexota bacterium]